MYQFNIYYLRFFTTIISILCFFNILYSYYFNLYLNIDAYFYTFLISLIPLLSFLIKSSDVKKVSIYYKIQTVILGYFILPVIIALPYYLSIYNISFIDAYFESISGFTSTGFTIFENIKHLDESIIIWRSSSQWIGGLYFLFSILLLIDIFDDNLKKTITNFLSFNSSEIFKQFSKILVFYILLTLIIFLIYNIFEFRSFISLNLALSVISSGGFLPTNNLSSILNNELKINLFSLTLLISFFGLFFLYNVFLIKNKGLKSIQEDLYLLFYLLFVYSIFFIFSDKNIDFNYLFLAISSSVSNVGISLEKTPQKFAFIFLLLIIVGGSFFSTSSGLRFVKIYSLIKFSINELISHSKPKNIFLNKLAFSDKNMNLDDFYKYFLTIIIFIISLIILSSILSIMGLSIDEAFKLSILTLMNTVNSTMTGLPNFNFQEINHISKYSLILFMIIGRVELITILILCKKFFFKN
jgi:trk system potassium uptake protein TrkH